MTTSGADPAAAGAVRRLGRARLFDRQPHLHRLGNGRYTVLLSNAGSGSSHCDGIALTRWRDDPVEDGDGWFHYLRDLDSGRIWSIGYQPTGGSPSATRRASRRERVDITRVEDGIGAALTVAVAPDAAGRAAPVRAREPLGPAAADRGHQLSRGGAAGGRRRCRPSGLLQAVRADRGAARAAGAAGEPAAARRRRARPLAGALADRRGRGGRASQYETDRARFIGRGRSLAAPAGAGRATRRSPAAPATCSTRSSACARWSSWRRARPVAWRSASGWPTARAAALALVDRHADARGLAPVLAPAQSPARGGAPAAAPDAAPAPAALPAGERRHRGGRRRPPRR